MNINHKAITFALVHIISNVKRVEYYFVIKDGALELQCVSSYEKKSDKSKMYKETMYMIEYKDIPSSIEQKARMLRRGFLVEFL